MELKTYMAALFCFCIFSVIIAPSAQSAADINGELEDECLAFLNWFEKTIHEGQTIEGAMLDFHGRGIEGVPYKVLDWCAKHKLIKIR